MGECINPAFHTRVVIERVAVEVTEFRGVPLWSGASKGCSDVGFDEGSATESDEALKTLHKQDDVPIVYVFSYQDYFTFSVCSVKVGVEVSQVGLIPPFCFRQGVVDRICL